MTFFMSIAQRGFLMGLFCVFTLYGCERNQTTVEKEVNNPMTKDSLIINANDLKISKAWVRALPGNNTAAYFELMNTSSDTVKVVGAFSSEVEEVQIHETTMDEGLMSMRKLTHVDLKASQTVKFESGGKHLMLLGVKKPLQVGNVIPVTLQLEGDKEISFEAKIKTGLAEDSDETHDNHHH